MIYITGDTHGDVDYYKLLELRKKPVSYNDYLIICGDAGIVWSTQDLNHMKTLYNRIHCTIIYVDGNHENFHLLNTFPLVEYLGALMHQIDEHIFHVLRGEIMTIENKTFLCLGGAVSIDKYQRTPNISWWAEEEITYHDIDNALMNLAKVDNKVDYVITHCCDTATVIDTFGFRRDICTDQLMFIDKVVEYKHWYFGHYHYDVDISEKKTCLYKRIIELE